MKVYNNSQKQSKQSTDGVSSRRCGYCGVYGHVQTECGNAISDWAYWKKFEVPLKDPKCWVLAPTANGYHYGRWYSQPKEWGKWYTACEKASIKIEAKQKLAKKGVTRRASKCGFCGDLEHNRRACPEMDTLLDRFVLANQKWRQRFYDRFVTDLGLSVGAVIKCSSKVGYQKPEKELIGIITSINWDELSMFCYTDQASGFYQRLDDKFSQPLRISVKVGDKTHSLIFVDKGARHINGALNDTAGGVLVDKFLWNNVEYISTIARSETPLDEEWVEEARRDSLVFLVKKYSMETLTKYNVIRMLEMQENL